MWGSAELYLKELPVAQARVARALSELREAEEYLTRMRNGLFWSLGRRGEKELKSEIKIVGLCRCGGQFVVPLIWPSNTLPIATCRKCCSERFVNDKQKEETQ